MTNATALRDEDVERILGPFEVRYKPDQIGMWPARQALRDEIAAALSAVPQAGVPEGYRLVPESAIKWLMGEGPDENGDWFGDTPRPTRGAFWWRIPFGRMLSTAPPPPVPAGGMAEGGELTPETLDRWAAEDEECGYDPD